MPDVSAGGRTSSGNLLPNNELNSWVFSVAYPHNRAGFIGSCMRNPSFEKLFWSRSKGALDYLMTMGTESKPGLFWM